MVSIRFNKFCEEKLTTVSERCKILLTKGVDVMTLGDCIKEYREEHDLSQRQFADMIGISNAYISILEKNVNPKTGEAPAPSYGVYKKVADILQISVQELMERADESTVSLGSGMSIAPMTQSFHPVVIDMIEQHISNSGTAKERLLLSLFATMADSDKEKLLDYAQYIVDSYKRPDKRRPT